eukprot:SAG31_NODE_20378_length_576_cov_1.088050_1_plen_35_part_10
MDVHFPVKGLCHASAAALSRNSRVAGPTAAPQGWT